MGRLKPCVNFRRYVSNKRVSRIDRGHDSSLLSGSTGTSF